MTDLGDEFQKAFKNYHLKWLETNRLEMTPLESALLAAKWMADRIQEMLPEILEHHSVRREDDTDEEYEAARAIQFNLMADVIKAIDDMEKELQ